VSHLYSLTIPRSAAVVDNNLNTSSDNGFGIGRSTSREIKTDDNSSPLSVTSVTWNSTGAMVMAAYGVPDKRGWCESAGERGRGEERSDDLATQFLVPLACKVP